MTAATLNSKIASAMATALSRRDDSPEAQIERLRDEVERLKHLIGKAEERATYWQEVANSGKPSRTSAPAAADVWEPVKLRHWRCNGREAGTQVELARRLNRKSYDVCKWVADGRIKTVVAPDGQKLVWLDQNAPTRKKKSS